MKEMVFDPFISLFIRTGFALFFALMAVHKLRDLQAFQTVIFGYNIAPKIVITPLSIGLAWAELSIAALLLWLPSLGAICAAALLGVYALIIAFNVARGLGVVDLANLGFSLCFLFFAVRSASTLRAVSGRMREVGHV